MQSKCTSVASHAREACRGRSDAEFTSKLEVLLQKADETKLWLELLIEDCQITHSLLPTLHQELGELITIFTTMVGKIKNR